MYNIELVNNDLRPALNAFQAGLASASYNIARLF